MIRHSARLLLAGAFVFGSGAFVATGASAQATRTWVSGVGDDVNPCSRTAPCKTFAGTIPKTAAGGEINCLDPGGFGGVTITKSITIKCDSLEAGVLITGSNGIVVNDSGAGTAQVTLIGLDLEGLGFGTSGSGIRGIWFISGASLTVLDTHIRAFRDATNGIGISFTPSGSAKLVVENSSVTGSGTGIFIQPSGTGVADATIADTLISNNSGYGIAVNTNNNTGTGNRVTIRNSVVSSNVIGGVNINTPAGFAKATVAVGGTTIGYNPTGIVVNGGLAVAYLSGNHVFGGTFGVRVVNGGTYNSFGNNAIFDNGSTATPTPIANQ